MKKLILLTLSSLGLLSLSGFANAEVKTLTFTVNNQTGQNYEVTLSSKKKKIDPEGCIVTAKESVIECISDKDGKFPTPVLATFVFKTSGEGPTIFIDEDSFSVKNNGENNLAKIHANMESEGKWTKNMKVNITLPKDGK